MATIPAFDFTKLELPRLDWSKLDPRSIDWKSIELPKFDMPKFEMPALSVDSDAVDKIVSFAKDAAYATVGLGVVAAEQVQARGRALGEAIDKQVASSKAQLAEFVDAVGSRASALQDKLGV